MRPEAEEFLGTSPVQAANPRVHATYGRCRQGKRLLQGRADSQPQRSCRGPDPSQNRGPHVNPKADVWQYPITHGTKQLQKIGVTWPINRTGPQDHNRQLRLYASTASSARSLPDHKAQPVGRDRFSGTPVGLGPAAAMLLMYNNRRKVAPASRHAVKRFSVPTRLMASYSSGWRTFVAPAR